MALFVVAARVLESVLWIDIDIIMNFTDYLRLSEHKIFKAVSSTLPKDINKAQNVLIVKDDVLFTWDFQSNCVLTLNVKTARSREGDNVIYQVKLHYCTLCKYIYKRTCLSML